MELKLFDIEKRLIHILNNFMRKYKMKEDTRSEKELQTLDNIPMYPRDSKIYSDKRLINKDNGSMGRSRWTCFYVEINKSIFFDSFGGQPDKFIREQLPKPIIFHKYKIQAINSRLCGSYCLYFFDPIERMDYYKTTLKMFFG